MGLFGGEWVGLMGYLIKEVFWWLKGLSGFGRVLGLSFKVIFGVYGSLVLGS